MVSDVPFRVVQQYTANAVPVMKTGIPCAHVLTGKTCSHHRDPVFIAGTSLHSPCSTLYGIAVYDSVTKRKQMS